MPELPDVEGFRRIFRRHAVGKQLRGVTADSDMLRDTTLAELRSALVGEVFADPWRHGKWLVCPSGDLALTMHFGMTGALSWADPPHRHDRLTLRFDDGELRYRNQRKFGGIWLTDAGNTMAVAGDLGPDALRLSDGELHDRVAGRGGGVKAALMDQRVVAGLGNLTVDEILWRARIAPRHPVSKLSDRDYARLTDSTKEVLRISTRAGRLPDRAGWLTGARYTPDPHCPRCGTPLRRLTVAGRTTYACPHCQH